MGLASTLVACASSASLSLHREHVLLNNPQTERYEHVVRKRDLAKADYQTISQPIDQIVFEQERPYLNQSPLSHDHRIKRSVHPALPFLGISSNFALDTGKSRNKRSAQPVAPYRGHSFRRNSSLRQRPVRTRSRFYRRRENPNRVPPSG